MLSLVDAAAVCLVSGVAGKSCLCSCVIVSYEHVVASWPAAQQAHSIVVVRPQAALLLVCCTAACHYDGARGTRILPS